MGIWDGDRVEQAYPGFTDQGTWDADTTYSNNDLVHYENLAYIYIRETAGKSSNTPDSDATRWVCVS